MSGTLQVFPKGTLGIVDFLKARNSDVIAYDLVL